MVFAIEVDTKLVGTPSENVNNTRQEVDRLRVMNFS